MKSKNVLLVISHLGVGGTEIQTLNTVRALVLGGYKVTVLCLFRHIASVVADYKWCGAKVYCASPQYSDYGISIEYPKNLKLVAFLYKHLKKIIKEEDIDIVHVQYMTPAATVILVLRYLLFQRCIIATAHTAADIYKDLRLLHFIQRHCLRAFTCITERAERSFFGTSQLYTTETVLGKRNHFTIYNALPKATALQSTVKVCANEQESNSFELLQRQREGSVGCDEENFSSPEEKQLVALLPKLCDEVTNGQQTTDFSNQRDEHTNLDTFTHTQACAGLPDEDTQSMYDNENDNENQQSMTAINQRPEGAINRAEHFNRSAASLTGTEGAYSKLNTIGVVSRLELIKGMDLVVPAFAEVLKRFPEVRLLVVGDGTLRATMEQQAAELGCADRITWVGRQPQEELNKWYGQMGIVLMPSRSEGFGLTAIEAMANGCVMVASHVGGLPEVVRNGVCGLLHRTEDVQDMVDKVCMLLDDAALYDRLRAQSLTEVKKYSFERYATLINNLYGKLALSN